MPVLAACCHTATGISGPSESGRGGLNGAVRYRRRDSRQKMLRASHAYLGLPCAGADWQHGSPLKCFARSIGSRQPGRPSHRRRRLWRQRAAQAGRGPHPGQPAAQRAAGSGGCAAAGGGGVPRVLDARQRAPGRAAGAAGPLGGCAAPPRPAGRGGPTAAAGMWPAVLAAGAGHGQLGARLQPGVRPAHTPAQARLDVLDAETEGQLGFVLELELGNALRQRQVAALLTQVRAAPAGPAVPPPHAGAACVAPCACARGCCQAGQHGYPRHRASAVHPAIVPPPSAPPPPPPPLQVVVDPSDPAFGRPTKHVGPRYSKEVGRPAGPPAPLLGRRPTGGRARL